MLDLKNPRQPIAAPPAPTPTAPVQDLSWLVRALRLRNTSVPTALGTDPVQPTVDVLQDGWGLAQYNYAIQILKTAAPAVNKADIVTPLETDTQVITAYTLQQTIVVAGAVPVEAAIILYTGAKSINATAGPFTGIPMAEFFIPIADAFGTGLSWAAIAGRIDATLVVPPKWGLALVWNPPTTPPGYQVEGIAQIALIPGQQRGR